MGKLHKSRVWGKIGHGGTDPLPECQGKKKKKKNYKHCQSWRSYPPGWEGSLGKVTGGFLGKARRVPTTE